VIASLPHRMPLLRRRCVVLLLQRAEHNEYMLSTLEEVALHQQNIESIELIGQLCPRLRILYLQNNLIGKVQNLHKLKVRRTRGGGCAWAAWACARRQPATTTMCQLQELEYLNLAINNITKVQNLQRCESLQRLDLTVNFIARAGLLSLASLAANHHLRELFLIGNPCTDWHGYRQFVLGKLQQLAKLVRRTCAHRAHNACVLALVPRPAPHTGLHRCRPAHGCHTRPLCVCVCVCVCVCACVCVYVQDGQAITPSERIAARQALPALEQQLVQELAAEGVDVKAAASVENDGQELQDAEVAETGYVDEHGELRRPWCPQTRILEHREMVRARVWHAAGRRAG
jgi:protein TilB